MSSKNLILPTYNGAAINNCNNKNKIIELVASDWSKLSFITNTKDVKNTTKIAEPQWPFNWLFALSFNTEFETIIIPPWYIYILT